MEYKIFTNPSNSLLIFILFAFSTPVLVILIDEMICGNTELNFYYDHICLMEWMVKLTTH